MHRARLTVALRVLTLTLLPAFVSAQDRFQPWADPEDLPPRVDISASAGFLVPTGWSNLVLLGSISSAAGVLEQVLTRDLRVEPKSSFGGAATYWRGRYGFRSQVGFSRSSLTIGGAPLAGEQPPSTGATTVSIDTWLYDVRGAVGFIDYRPGRVVWPYGFFGLGGITYNPKRVISPPLTFIEHGPSLPITSGTIVVVDPGRTFLFEASELGVETVFALNFGVGTDFRLPLGPAGVGLRLELSDHVAPSPLGLGVRELSPFGFFGPDAGVRFGLVHHLSATAGIVVHIGR